MRTPQKERPTEAGTAVGTSLKIKYARIVSQSGGDCNKAMHTADRARFLGLSTQRQMRAIAALLVSPQSRESIDSRVGCSNGPDLISELRRRGLTIPCDRTPCFDRDGNEVQRGIYYLTEQDKRLIAMWKRKRQNGGGL